MSSWGPDFDTNKVVIHLESYSDAAAQTLVDTYGGPDLIQVLTQPTIATASGRTDDAPAFSGGDSLTAPSGGGCSSWFTTKSNANGAIYQFTSAHCGTGTFKLSGGKPFGTVTSQMWSGSIDAETFKIGGQARVWADPGATVRPVESRNGTSSVGVLLCTDGVSDRETCNVKVLSGDTSVSYDGHTVTHTIEGQQTSGIPAFTNGDSGGPVYQLLSGGLAQARGMVAAHDLNTNAHGWIVNVRYIESAFTAVVCSNTTPC